ncbi:unnamed protein product [Penicillium egyptiacum]|uniref:Major facilitator superfamily (MFS) profile domain-containing protein n=1 Tax=Penicillium egyptiacum TaxID=1303716 RepID=A0A9W4P7Z6_9EURO|nr:unnamed protein product [Penicillium egyptiacum]
MGFHLKGTKLSLGVAFTTSYGFLLFRYDQGVFSGLIENGDFQNTFNQPSQMAIGQITATYNLGCFFGAIFCIAYGDRIGRRLSIGLGCLVLTVGAVIQTTSFSIAQMIVGRFITGLGNGLNTTTIPRFPIAFQIFYALITTLLLPWLPDSPRWLIQKGRFEEAKAVTTRLHAKSIHNPELLSLHEASTQGIQHELKVSKVSWRALLQSDSLHTRRRVLLGIGTQLMQQWGGINAINYYLPVVFTSLHVSRQMSLILSAYNAINVMIFTTVAITVIKIIGRKRLMI